MKDQVLTTYEEDILNKVRQLNRLEKEFLKFTYEIKKPENKDELEKFFDESFRISIEAFETKNQILAEFHDISNLRIYDNAVLNTLDKIRRNEKLCSVSFYEGLAKLMNEKADSWKDRWEITIKDFLSTKDYELFDEFHSWFDVYEYYAAKCKIGPIISSFHVPGNVLVYFDEIKETFAFGQYRASIALSRALLEMSLFERLNHKKVFKKADTKITNINVAKEDNLFSYIKLARWVRILDSINTEIAHDIRKQTNEILHIKDREIKLTEKETFKIIFDTVGIIERLYR